MEKRKVEIFSAGCTICDQVVQMVNQTACPSCDVSVLDIRDAEAADRAKKLGVHTVPAVVVDGVLAACCAGRGPNEQALKAAGVGQPR